MASVYVGTYAKFNSGSIAGAWIDLDKFTDKESFLEYCAELHSDEADPEFMYQDFEGFPERFYSESGLDDALFDWLALDNDEQLLLAAYIDITGDNDASIEEAHDRFMGQYESDIDFVMELTEQCGDIPSDLPSYIVIDWESTARNIMFDFSESNGYYFSN